MPKKVLKFKRGNGESPQQFADRMNAKFGEKIEPSELFATLHAFLGRFVVYPSSHAHIAHVLWIAHTHCMEAWESTPRIAFLSPEPSSGKTRALEISELLVPNAVEAVNVTPAYLFRKVGADNAKPTILYDEIDTVFGPKAKENEEIRGLLNAGHRRGAVAGRCVMHGNQVVTEEIPAFCAVALAGLGWLPDTILSRSIIIRMRRRAPHEKVTPFRRRVHGEEGNKVRDLTAAWAAGAVKELTEARPEMPLGIEDRNADVWEPLLAIADAIGGDWPERARVVAVTLVTEAAEREPSLGIRLLTDLRDIFIKTKDHKDYKIHMTTAVILERLHAIAEAPWNDLKGKPLDERGLALRLRQYQVKSKTLNLGGTLRAKGYAWEDLHDVWQRYLPPLSPPERSVTSVTSVTGPDFQGGKVTDVTDRERSVTDIEGEKNPHESSRVTDVTDVTAVGRDRGEEEMY